MSLGLSSLVEFEELGWPTLTRPDEQEEEEEGEGECPIPVPTALPSNKKNKSSFSNHTDATSTTSRDSYYSPLCNKNTNPASNYSCTPSTSHTAKKETEIVARRSSRKLSVRASPSTTTPKDEVATSSISKYTDLSSTLLHVAAHQGAGVEVQAAEAVSGSYSNEKEEKRLSRQGSMPDISKDNIQKRKVRRTHSAEGLYKMDRSKEGVRQGLRHETTATSSCPPRKESPSNRMTIHKSNHGKDAGERHHKGRSSSVAARKSKHETDNSGKGGHKGRTSSVESRKSKHHQEKEREQKRRSSVASRKYHHEKDGQGHSNRRRSSLASSKPKLEKDRERTQRRDRRSHSVHIKLPLRTKDNAKRTKERSSSVEFCSSQQLANHQTNSHTEPISSVDSCPLKGQSNKAETKHGHAARLSQSIKSDYDKKIADKGRRQRRSGNMACGDSKKKKESRHNSRSRSSIRSIEHETTMTHKDETKRASKKQKALTTDKSDKPEEPPFQEITCYIVYPLPEPASEGARPPVPIDEIEIKEEYPLPEPPDVLPFPEIACNLDINVVTEPITPAKFPRGHADIKRKKAMKAMAAVRGEEASSANGTKAQEVTSYTPATKTKPTRDFELTATKDVPKKMHRGSQRRASLKQKSGKASRDVIESQGTSEPSIYHHHVDEKQRRKLTRAKSYSNSQTPSRHPSRSRESKRHRRKSIATADSSSETSSRTHLKEGSVTECNARLNVSLLSADMCHQGSFIKAREPGGAMSCSRRRHGNRNEDPQSTLDQSSRHVEKRKRPKNVRSGSYSSLLDERKLSLPSKRSQHASRASILTLGPTAEKNRSADDPKHDSSPF